MEKIKVISIDMDGTLLNSDGFISVANMNSLRKAIENDIIIVPASGRPLVDLPKQLFELDLKYAITKNGAILNDLTNNCEVYHNFMNPDSVSEVIKKCKNFDVLCNSEYGLTHYVDKHNIDKYNDGKHFYFFKDESIFDDLPQYILDTRLKTDKMFIHCFQSSEVSKVMALEPQFIDLSFTNVGYNTIDIVSRNSSKAYGLKRLTQLLNISKENVAAIGDSDNDMLMMVYAGYSVAMGNAFDFIKEISDYTTDTNDNDGVSKAIELIIERNNSIK